MDNKMIVDLDKVEKAGKSIDKFDLNYVEVTVLIDVLIMSSHEALKQIRQ